MPLAFTMKHARLNALLLTLVSLAALGLAAQPSYAQTTVLGGSSTAIQYLFSGTASGTLGSTSFTDAAISFMASGDASTVYSPNNINFYSPVSTPAYTISGIGTGSFTDTFDVFDNQANSVIGLEDFGPTAGDVFDESAPVFATYNLSTALQSTASVGSAFGNFGRSIGTTGGSLTFTSFGQGAFSANGPSSGSPVSAAPEPAQRAGLGFIAFGLLALGLNARRKSKAAASTGCV